MNAEIIAVGSELLLGQITNTNGRYLSEQLSYLGINVYYHSVVGDNNDRLTGVLNNAKQRSNLLIITGGLGPTKDDLTKETVANVLGKNLVYDLDTEELITAFFKQRHRQMTENNRKQAQIIEGAKVFPNDHGLACGLVVEEEDCRIIMLPGPPKELIPMVETYVIPYLRTQVQHQSYIQSRVLRFFDIGESLLVDMIDDLLEEQTNPTIAPLASIGEVTLRLTVKGQDKQENDILLDELQEKILARLGKYFYGIGQETLMERLVEQLKKNNNSIASAESLTGGLFATELTEQPGIGAIFPGAFITYENDMKQSQLHIPTKILENDGAVSHACAKKMAEQARILAKSDFGISFTGVAGPDPLEGKPPGLVYIGLSSKWDTVSYEVQLAGSRATIRERTVKYGAYYLLQWMRKETKKVDE